MQLQNTSLNNFSKLPEELEYHVLSYLEPKDLTMCVRVCKHWQGLASDENFWKNLIPEAFILQNKTIKQAVIEYNQHSVYSIDELAARIKKFASEIPANQIAEMICKFPLNPGYTFKVKFGHGNVTATGDAQIHEYCIMRPDTPRDCDAYLLTARKIEFSPESKHFVRVAVHFDSSMGTDGWSQEAVVYHKHGIREIAFVALAGMAVGYLSATGYQIYKQNSPF